MPPIESPKVVRITREFLDTIARDQEIVLDAQPAAAVPVRTGFDREHHPFLDRAGSGLMRVRRFVGSCTDAVRDRMGRLAGIAGLGDSVADEAIELRETRAGATVVERTRIHAEERVEELVVACGELSWTHVLRVVAPVPVRAHPDLEQGRLVLLHGPVSGRGEGANSRARPDEREAERELDPALPARPLPMDEPLPERSGLALLHPGFELP